MPDEEPKLGLPQYLAVESVSQIVDDLTALMNTYAADGWELVTCFGRPGGSVIFIFRK